jgi:hypothetical protein
VDSVPPVARAARAVVVWLLALSPPLSLESLRSSSEPLLASVAATAPNNLRPCRHSLLILQSIPGFNFSLSLKEVNYYITGEYYEISFL